MLAHRAPGQQPILLEQKRCFGRGYPGHRPGFRRFQSRHHSQQCGLAAAGRAAEGGEAALGNFQGKMIQHQLTAITKR